MPDNVKTLPDCVHCNANDYTGGGGTMGYRLTHMLYECRNCGNEVEHIHLRGRGCYVWSALKRDDAWDLRHGGEKGAALSASERERHRLAFINDFYIPFAKAHEGNDDRSLIPAGARRTVIVVLDLKDNNFHRVTEKESQYARIYSDADSEKHKTYWKAFNTFMGIDNAVEIDNGYFSDQKRPWYRVDDGDDTIIYGPRKRVDAIIVRTKVPFDATALKEARSSESDTFIVDDDRNPASTTTLEIHAWTQHKLVEFMGLVQQALKNHNRKKEPTDG